MELLDTLVDAGLLPEGRRGELLRRWRERGGSLADLVVRETSLTHDALADAVAAGTGHPRVADGEIVVAPRALGVHVPETLARKLGIAPVDLVADTLRVAFHDPAALHAAWEGPGGGLRVSWCVGTAPAVEAAVARLFPTTVPGRRFTSSAITAPSTTAPPTGEVPNRDFETALGLAPREDPVLLFQRKPEGPVMLTRKKGSPRTLATLGAAAERMFVADNLHQMAAAMATYLVNYFPRVLVLDLFNSPARVLAAHGADVELSVQDVHALPGIEVMLTEAMPYYGPAVADDAWTHFYAQLGGPPRTMLVMPVWRGDTARLMVYADAPTEDRLVDARELQNLAREMGMALESRGF
ncbi:MAG: hypothetical protein HY904_04250 [Deltaproteobacteria bacterium]|nr:hypothetical protein [Deltaproteobacteria bacterium]